MNKHQIIVTVEAESSSIAFQFVETAVEEWLDRCDSVAGIGNKPDYVHITTADGTRATQF